jgi:hypothetical protein
VLPLCADEVRAGSDVSPNADADGPCHNHHHAAWAGGRMAVEGLECSCFEVLSQTRVFFPARADHTHVWWHAMVVWRVDAARRLFFRYY